MADAVSKLAQHPKGNSKTQKKPPVAKQARIGVKRDDDLAEWYSQVLTRGKFVSYYDVQGCYILEPPIYFVWEQIKEYFDKKIKAIGSYPLFISQDNLEREKDHIEGFSAEVAWVTHGGKSKLEKPIGIRPTSETAMLDFHYKIQSHRDLPLRRNQWNNVVRPLLRSREFHWQEGHSAFLTRESAHDEVMQILDFYASVYEELLAVPVIKGQKTENEKFPGADMTTTVEGFVPANGRGIQAGTSHLLGQRFAKMYDITVEDPAPKAEGEASKRLYVWQNSWGLSTRSLGAMIMIHGDDRGAVIPPRVCEIQAVLIPVGLTVKHSPEARKELMDKIESIANELRNANIRVEADTREHYSPGWKFNEYEMTGVPLRLEFGPKDAANGVVTTVRRDNGEKGTIKVSEVATGVFTLLETIQKDMYNRAKEAYLSHRIEVTDWSDMVPRLNEKNVLLIPHCLDGDCADAVKKETADMCKTTAEIDIRAPSMGAKALCIPFEQKELPPGTKCLRPSCARDAQKWVQFGRSY
ncbi:prolyl-tRNA synthetase [Cenococcum geophilum 1.58]|uniref:prolyl-tRNA synthetase n=1 Tax=Cenococcum geophilum 1.58 TaxID=794803 RepID=UPI00358E244E|nr:prolyl-tRNA synthetase [Cenococcum geophilum 1.58]